MPVGRTIFSFFFPAAIVVAATGLLLRSDARSALFALHGFAILIYAAAALVAWRFHYSRMLLAAIALAIADAGLRYAAAEPIAAAAARDLAAILLPSDLIALAFVEERGLFSRATASAAAVLSAQVLVGVLLCRPEMQAARILEAHLLPARAIALPGVPQFGLLIFVVGALFFATRYALLRNPVESGFFWTLAACFLAFSSHARGVYLMTAGAVLAVATVENSYMMAFHDHLTGLPGRRAFHRMAATLRDRYAIAVVDIDHFKKFNDTFGHETGDQVLRMVAARIARVTGGGKGFRWGGEEFVVLFPGRSSNEALEHVELLRQLIEASSFIVRGRDRRKHSAEERGRTRSGQVKEAWVTVSVGLAEGRVRQDLQQAMQAADTALYTAKAAGRNRVEIAIPRRESPQRLSRAAESER